MNDAAKKGIAALIIAHAKPKSAHDDEGGQDPMEGMHAAASDMMDAIKEGDVAKFASALDAYLECHEGYERPEEEAE